MRDDMRGVHTDVHNTASYLKILIDKLGLLETKGALTREEVEQIEASAAACASK